MSSNLQTDTAPAVFISHGSPMVAVQRGPYQSALAKFGREVKPKAIVSISAHWGSGRIIEVNGAEKHSTVHDFGGFPAALYDLQYDAPGDPAMAARIETLLHDAGYNPSLTNDRGLDHGTWIPLRLMYPAVNVPVVALSIPLQFLPLDLYKLGETLAPLRREGVLILGSGGIVHNLRLVNFGDQHAPVEQWANEFDIWFRGAVASHDLSALFDFANRAPHTRLAVPTFEHFAPVFVILGSGGRGAVSTIFDGFEHATISMRSFAIA